MAGRQVQDGRNIIYIYIYIHEMVAHVSFISSSISFTVNTHLERFSFQNSQTKNVSFMKER